VYLELLGEERRLDRRLCTTSAMCARCHSGGLTRPILCQNGECSVLYARLGTQTKLENLALSMNRIEKLNW